MSLILWVPWKSASVEIVFVVFVFSARSKADISERLESWTGEEGANKLVHANQVYILIQDKAFGYVDASKTVTESVENMNLQNNLPESQ